MKLKSQQNDMFENLPVLEKLETPDLDKGSTGYFASGGSYITTSKSFDFDKSL